MACNLQAWGCYLRCSLVSMRSVLAGSSLMSFGIDALRKYTNVEVLGRVKPQYFT